MNLKAYKLVHDWRVIEVKELSILFLEGITENGDRVLSERLIRFDFQKREAHDHFSVFSLGSINQEFAKLLESQDILYSNLNFEECVKK